MAVASGFSRLLLFLLAFMLVVAAAFSRAEPPGREGWVVLFDEAHRPMTSVVYRDAIEPGHYARLARLLESQGFRVTALAPGEKLTPEVLRGVDVLVIMPGRREYGSDEVEAVLSWVRSGGSLLLLGDYDHYPRNLRELASRLGVVFLADNFTGGNVLMNIAQNDSYTLYPFYPVFTGEMLNTSSPLMEGIMRLEMYSATGLLLPSNATVLVRASREARWFDSYHSVWGPPAPGVPVAGWFRYGKGVVVVIGDINMWFDVDIDRDGTPSLYDSDNYRFALNVFRFLAAHSTLAHRGTASGPAAIPASAEAEHSAEYSTASSNTSTFTTPRPGGAEAVSHAASTGASTGRGVLGGITLDLIVAAAAAAAVAAAVYRRRAG